MPFSAGFNNSKSLYILSFLSKRARMLSRQCGQIGDFLLSILTARLARGPRSLVTHVEFLIITATILLYIISFVLATVV